MMEKKSLKKYIYERDERKCWFCEKALFFRQMTLDHYLPRSSKGPDEVYNLVSCCQKCNKEKKDYIPDDYEEVLIKLFKKAVKDKKIGFSKKLITYPKLIEIVEEVDRIEAINNQVVFQSLTHRIYVLDHRIIKIIKLGGMLCTY